MTQQRPKHPVLRALPLIAVAACAVLVACDAADDAARSPVDPGADAEGSQAQRERAAVLREVSAATNGEHPISEDESLEPPALAESVAAAADTIVVLGVVNDIPRAQLRQRDEPASDGSAQSAPIFYIDGERAEAGMLGRLDRATIESIHVIKGPAAALYGADQADGVVLVATKNR